MSPMRISFIIRSVLLISDQLTSKLLNVHELDPARRHLPSYHRGSQRPTAARYQTKYQGGYCWLLSSC